jgi:hypothetical protein
VATEETKLRLVAPRPLFPLLEAVEEDEAMSYSSLVTLFSSTLLALLTRVGEWSVR